ncbi:metallophosphoesterase family protein [Aureispira anguillae]|uniref:Phosphoesterase n=1 Tax=Aureispira anguillae TaxID=2864201 RepID=A0A915YJJ6_9BACT|nr:metallophosphoesterase family protein [Aureispira anguillae]BDS14369.1 metallophosphatase family protein [Aureispira anguillae]
MKIAIISDVHGNIDALNRVIKEIKREKIEVVFSLGDQLGYYYDAEKVYDQLEKLDTVMIAGNHERIFLDYLIKNNPEIDEKYGLCFQKYKNSFSQDLIQKIKNLPSFKFVKINSINFGLFHGASFDPDYYVYPTADKTVLEKFSDSPADVIFIGHSHYPFVFQCGQKLVVNVGSVGQSRVVGGIANWGIYDMSNHVYIPKSTLYDVQKVIDKLEKEDQSKYLKKILERNNFNYE